MDVRSLPEEVPFGGYRFLQNVTANAVGKLCRGEGYQRLLPDASPYNNQDLHDQLFDYARQPVSLLFEAVSTTGVHRLIAGTQNRLYALNDSAGNWRVISDDLGGIPSTTCSERQWKAAQVEDTVAFTNGLDAPSYWVFDQEPDAEGQSISPIQDLVTLNVTKANLVFAWKGILFVANVVADGVRVNHRIMWSDFRKPLSFLPAANSSLAGSHDLGFGEDILGVLPLGDSLLWYTTRGIWECQVGDPSGEVFSFRQRYGEPRTGQGCLAYRNTLVSIGDEHLYFGKDGIYLYNLYTTKPIRSDWMFRASSMVFDEIDDSVCNLAIGGYNPSRREAWFSWVKRGDTCPYRTLRLNTQYSFADIVDRGFTAFCSFRPSNSATVRDFLLSHCVCTSAQINADSVKEGGYCVTPADPVCGAPYTSLYSLDSTNTLGVGSIEDPNGALDPTSFAASLGGLTLDDLCAAEQAADECATTQRFVMAAANDFCLKEFGGIYGYERCTGTNEACGVYVLDGYTSILRSGPMDLGNSSHPKYLKRINIELNAAAQTIPSSIVGRVGWAHTASDPNVNACPIMWYALPAKALACASAKTTAQHVAAKTQPFLSFEWPTWIGGRYLYFEFTVGGTGGATCFSSITMDVAIRPQGL